MLEWKKNVRVVEPYVPGEQPKEEGVIKLNTNENPYPPSSKVVNLKMDLEKLRIYSDPEALELVSAIAGYHGLNNDQVFVGIGSDDVLAMSFMTFFNSDKPILFPDITYSFYDVWTELLRIPYKTKALKDDFSINIEDYYGENGGIVFPNPNAPTCLYMPLDNIRGILDHNRDVVVIVDEAYIDYAGESALSLIDDYDNLLVVRTFSKSRSMAGLRIGYAMGNSELISALNSVKFSFNSYTMNYLQIKLGVESIKDDVYFKYMIAKVKNTREWFSKELKRLGFSYPESSTNFVFATHNRVPAKELFEAAKKEKIYLRYFANPRIDNYLRITIGTDEEMKRLVEFFEKYLTNN